MPDGNLWVGVRPSIWEVFHDTMKSRTARHDGLVRLLDL